MDISVRDAKLFEFGPFVLDPMRRSLTREGAPVTLSPTLFDTLLYFVEHPGRVVSKDELMDAVWPRKVVEDSNISQTIYTLRRALAAADSPEPYILTQPGKGYRFAREVRIRTRRQGLTEPPTAALQASAPTAPDLVAESSPTPRHALPRVSRRTVAVAGVSLIVAALAMGIVVWRGHAPAPRRAVVLGEFQNLTHDPLFDRTFAEATRVELLQSPYLSVVPESRVQDTLALMTRPRDAPLTPAVGQEVCARNDGLALVRGSVAQIGGRYLLTLTADNCASGEAIAAEKAEVDGRDGLLPALDRLADRLRGRLGESATSVRAFSVPLPRARTASFEALKAYSEARWDVDHGRRADAIPLFQHAIALDPGFAAAHADLAVVFRNLKQTADSIAQIGEARRLAADVDARERLFIDAQYNTIVTRDADEGIRILNSWTAIYPNDAGAWSNLANALTWIGQAPAAIAPARRALALEPNVETNYVVLARAYLHAGDLAAARAVCDQAIAHKVDGDDLHGVAYQLAFARGDMPAADREMEWAKGKAGERSMLIEAGQGAYRLGQVRRGGALFARAVALGRAMGLGDFTAAPNAKLLWDMDLEDMARESLARVPAGFDSADYRFSLAEFGDAAKAQALQRADLTASPSDTLLTQIYAPEVRAALALRAGRPREAVEALRPAQPYEARTFDVPYLRGLAWLAAGDGAAAAAEFHKILDHPGVESVSVHYALARLGLARAEARRGDGAAARRDYEAFLTDWKNADPDMPLLGQARAEYARLVR